MTVQAPPSTRLRLLGPAPDGPVPHLDTAGLADLVERAGLTGRGGAGFPTATKLRAVAAAASAAGTEPVVVANAMEGEPLSQKDALLLSRSPRLVLDGLTLVGSALGARRRILALGPGMPGGPAVDTDARARGIDVRRLGGGFVAGQESALVHQLEGGPAVPRDPLVRVTTRGVGGRPTLVLNAETLAQLSLVARYGAPWFRELGTPEDAGTALLTISGAVERPGVVELPRGTRLADALATASPGSMGGVLVGGYHGAWLPITALDTTLDRVALGEYGASVGAGVLHVLGSGSCPIRATAEIVRQLAGEAAGQCGPCVNGLPRMADAMMRLALLSPDRALPAQVERLRLLVTGRGACAHPDGTARLVASTMRVFADHVDAHLAGHCPADGSRR